MVAEFYTLDYKTFKKHRLNLQSIIILTLENEVTL